MSTTTERILIALFLIVAVILAMRDANATLATHATREFQAQDDGRTIEFV